MSSLVDTNRGSCYYTGRAYLGATFSCYLGQSNNPYIHGYRGYYFYIGGFYNISEKEFKTYDQQLDIFESRGLIVENRAAAIEYLSEIGYYCLINEYKDPFINNKLQIETYIEGANFF